MKKNLTEIFPIKTAYTFNSPDIRNKKETNIFKVEHEIKSLPEEIGKNLKKVLSKHELTPELYIPKRIPENKDYNKNILITKIRNYNKYISDRKKMAKKLGFDSSSFSKVYNYIKEVEGVNNTQYKYFDELERVYLGKNYNMKNCMIKPGDNIFSYSILLNKTFGQNLKQDAVKLVHEINNKDIRRENKLLFKFNDEVIEQKFQKKVNNRNKKILKRIITQNDFDIEELKKVGNKKYRLSIYEQNYRIIKNQRINSLKNLDSHKNIVVKTEEDDDYLNKIMKEKIQKLKDNLDNIETEFNNSYEEKADILQSIFGKKINIIKSQTNIQSNYQQITTPINPIIPIKISKAESSKKINIFNRKLTKDFSSDTNSLIGEKIKDFKSMRNSVINQLPKINKSFEEIKNLNLSSSATTNRSSADKKKDKENLELKLSQNTNEVQKKNNYIKVINPRQIFNNGKKSEKPTKLVNIKNIKKIKRRSNDNNIESYFTLYLGGNGDKKLISKKELDYALSKFKEKNDGLFDSFRKHKMKASNLHGFATNFQRVAEGKDFRKLYDKNKYLKKNNYKNLISNFYEYNDQTDDMNIKDIDNKISNLNYDLADFILNDQANQTHMNKIS